MTYPLYGIWDGKRYDYRRKAPAEPVTVVAGLEALMPDNPTRAFIADRGFLVFDGGANLAQVFLQHMTRAAQESCGRCTPCRVGTQRLRDLLHVFAYDEAGTEVLDEMEALALQVTETSLCGMGQTCAKALWQALREFRDQFRPLTVAQCAQTPGHFSYTTAPCIEVCPSKVDVPKYIDGVKGGKFDYALGVVLEKYSMAATCGRVCVRFCEDACRRKAVDGPVGIRMLKRYAADVALSGGKALEIPLPDVRRDERVAVIGAGPAGITCAYKLLLDGFQVDLFDAQKSAGGMASVGIPSYRLPKDVLKAETETLIRHLGGRFFFDKALGRDFTLDELWAQGYRAIFLGYGASQGTLLGVKNEDPSLAGYVSGVDFLLKVHKFVEYGLPYDVTGDVVVVGGGNVAMDCVRSAKRMGARSVHLVYRRTVEDMPAERDEVIACGQEGIHFHCLSNPSSLVIENGRVVGVELLTMRQTELDARGRRGVEPVPGTEHVMPCDLVVAAIGQQVDRAVLRPEDGIQLDKWHCITVNPDTLETTRRGVFAGGDCVLGPLTLVNALDHGDRAAASIREYLLTGDVVIKPEARMQQLLAANKLLLDEPVAVPPSPRERAHVPELPAETRVRHFKEVDGCLSKAAAYEEAKRCLRCYRVYSLSTARPLAHAE
ncbi:FAD-dependent oxidoreductase [Paludibacterium purpuratum]|uniref:Formate dehydrogenase beta subunit n=1 Tax=Paludibacterium purpuratum TaxID=1144873 RepID=A0A4V6PZ64_9NEIS|nr:FAD-dependent oxidoreductase [Paludibacterium purpuratum]TDR73090.1 formate dehydrogenase beta subunit [Paludibacterium purpuratum]